MCVSVCVCGSANSLISLARSARALCSCAPLHSSVHLLACPFTHSRAHGKEVFVYELNASISCSFNPLWAARQCVYVCVSVCVCVSVRMCMRVCMHVSPLHFVSIVQVRNKRFREFEKKTGYRWTDGLTERRIKGTMDGRTDGYKWNEMF